jgi:hypothetical protein
LKDHNVARMRAPRREFRDVICSISFTPPLEFWSDSRRQCEQSAEAV